jgi:general secretion pathway protein G
MVCLTVSGERAMRGRRGFTLIELLVVMSIIGMLLSVALPRYYGSLQRSKETVLRQDLLVMRDAIDKYYGDLGKYPEGLNALVDGRYLRAIPVDPITDKADSWVTVENAGDADDTGVRDVKSGADGTALDGTAFAEW